MSQRTTSKVRDVYHETMFRHYAGKLRKAQGVVESGKDSDDKAVRIFTSNNDSALKVTLYLWKKGASFVGLDIEGVDTGYWHTAEEKDLDYYIRLAEAALRGDVTHVRSPVLRLPEVCLKVDGVWHCTLTDKADMWPYHYIKVRKKLVA